MNKIRIDRDAIEDIIQKGKSKDKTERISQGINFDRDIFQWLENHKSGYNITEFVNELLRLIINTYEKK